MLPDANATTRTDPYAKKSPAGPDQVATVPREREASSVERAGGGEHERHEQRQPRSHAREDALKHHGPERDPPEQASEDAAEHVGPPAGHVADDAEPEDLLAQRDVPDRGRDTEHEKEPTPPSGGPARCRGRSKARPGRRRSGRTSSDPKVDEDADEEIARGREEHRRLQSAKHEEDIDGEEAGEGGACRVEEVEPGDRAPHVPVLPVEVSDQDREGGSHERRRDGDERIRQQGHRAERAAEGHDGEMRDPAHQREAERAEEPDGDLGQQKELRQVARKSARQRSSDE